jgi:hypothetical protein
MLAFHALVAADGQDYDIYGEIDLEDLHGPAAPQTIALDVQDGDTMAERRDGAGAKGVMPGVSNYVSITQC